jgi:hypothetical protein
VTICAPDDTVVHRIVTEPLVPGTPSLVAIPRVTMAEILDDAVHRTPGAEFRYRTTFTALREDGDQVEADRYLLHDLGPGGRAPVVPISEDEVYLWRLHRGVGSPRPPADPTAHQQLIGRALGALAQPL